LCNIRRSSNTSLDLVHSAVFFVLCVCMFCIIFSHWLAEVCLCLQINMCVTDSVFPFIVILVSLIFKGSSASSFYCPPKPLSLPPHCPHTLKILTPLLWLPDGETILKVCLFVSTEYTKVTDGRTPRDGRGRAYSKFARDIVLQTDTVRRPLCDRRASCIST